MLSDLDVQKKILYLLTCVPYGNSTYLRRTLGCAEINSAMIDDALLDLLKSRHLVLEIEKGERIFMKNKDLADVYVEPKPKMAHISEVSKWPLKSRQTRSGKGFDTIVSDTYDKADVDTKVNEFREILRHKLEEVYQGGIGKLEEVRSLNALSKCFEEIFRG